MQKHNDAKGRPSREVSCDEGCATRGEVLSQRFGDTEDIDCKTSERLVSEALIVESARADSMFSKKVVKCQIKHDTREGKKPYLTKPLRNLLALGPSSVAQ